MELRARNGKLRPRIESECNFWNGRKGGKLLDESEPDITGASRSSPKGLGAKGKVTGQK